MNQSANMSISRDLVLRNAADLVPEVMSNIYDRCDRGRDLSITSLKELDDLIIGFRKKKLVVVGGRPGQGKSSLTSQFGRDLFLQGKRVAFLNLEMTTQVFVERLLCCEEKIDNYLVNTGFLAKRIDEYGDRILDFNEKMKKATLVINSTARTLKDIERLLEGVNVDVIIIDYCQLIKTTGDRRTALEDFVRNIREYAISKNVCIILNSQINRATHDGTTIKPPQPWQLKESGSLEESADLVLLVHWPWAYNKNPQEVNKNDYEIDVAKNRDGRTGTVRCKFFPEYFRFESKPKEIDHEPVNSGSFVHGGRDRQVKDS